MKNKIVLTKNKVFFARSISGFAQWTGIVLIIQSLTCLVPSFILKTPTFFAQLVFAANILFGLITLFSNHKKLQKSSIWINVFLGSITVFVMLFFDFASSISGVYFIVWGSTIGFAQKRRFLHTQNTTVFLMALFVVFGMSFLFSSNIEYTLFESLVIVCSGSVLFIINLYQVLSLDITSKKSQKIFSDLDELNQKITGILTNDGSLENILWDVSEECIPLLGLEDCVIYLLDQDTNTLIQVAAYGDKTDDSKNILEQMTITPGTGVVGKCFSSKNMVLIQNTKNDKDYIVDIIKRNSELAIPIISNGLVVGVIDSEHSEMDFFEERHIRAFQLIASFCGIKITEYNAREYILQAEKIKKEITRYKELDELKTRFIANISHDLKTPLSLIKGPTKEIARLTNNDQIVRLTSYIEKNTDHLLRVVNQLLQLNDADQGSVHLYLENLNLTSLASSISIQYEGLAKEKELEFIVTTDADTIKMDVFRIEQIIHNLLQNAFNHTPKGGKIELSISIKKQELLIVVNDNGKGIDEENIEKVFERFYKVDVNNHQGTGIGLSLVKEHSEKLGGKVSVKSTISKGSKFVVTIPLDQTYDLEKGDSKNSIVDLNKNNNPFLMVVEDHADLNEFICSTFEADFKCISAYNGEEALKILETELPDIIITDLMMPKMDGNKLILALRANERTAHIPIIVLSAKDQSESRVDLYNIGADNYLVKPFEAEELKAVVSNTMSQRKKLIDLFRQNFLSSEIEKKEPFSIISIDDRPLLYKAVEVIMDNLDNESLNASFVSDKLSITRAKFIKEIKQQTNLTPQEMIRSIQLTEAKKMLSIENLELIEISMACGFEDPESFRRSFKKLYGVIPSEWRASRLLTRTLS